VSPPCRSGTRQYQLAAASLHGNEVFRKQGARVIASVEAADRMEKEGGDFVRGIAAALERDVKPGVPKAAGPV